MWQKCHHKSSHGLPPISQDRHYPDIQYIPRNMHTVFALLCFVVVIHWLIFPYPSGLLHWHCGNLTIAPVPAKQPWWICINTSCEFIMNDCITTTQQSTTKPCAYFLGYTVDDSRPSKRCQRWRRRANIPTTASTMNKVGINSLVLWNNGYHAWMIFDTFRDKVM